MIMFIGSAIMPDHMEIVTVVGLMAAACTSISFLPQAIKTIKTRQVNDLSLGMYSVLTTGIFLWFVYGLFINDLPIVLANGLTLVFTGTILVLIVRYK